MDENTSNCFLWFLTIFRETKILTRVGYVCGSHDPPDLLHWLEVGTEAAMTAENLFVNDGGDGETIETISKRFPQFDIKPSFAWNKENRKISYEKCNLTKWNCDKKSSRQINLVLRYYACESCSLTNFSRKIAIRNLHVKLT